jgi:hypothetical protein
MSRPDRLAQWRRVMQREREGRGLPADPVTAWQVILAALAGEPGQPIALPPHVHAHLEQVAWRIVTLADGRDYEAVAKAEGETGGKLVLAVRTIGAAEAAARLPAALGVVGPRKNAFRAARRDHEAWHVAVQLALAVASGVSPRDARRWAMAQAGINGSGRQAEADAQRILRRVVARGKRPRR